MITALKLPLKTGFSIMTITFLMHITAFADPAQAGKDLEFFARIYMSETEAYKFQMDAQTDRVLMDTFVLTDTEVKLVRKRMRIRMFTDTYRVYKIYRTGETLPYRFAIPLQEPGQHEFMDIMYGVNLNATIHRIDMMIYREPIGGEVQNRRFMKQFKGRSLKTSKFRVNLDVIHVVGATISSHSVSNAARRALDILKLQGYTH